MLMPGPVRIALRREPGTRKAFVDLKGPGEEAETCWFDLPWLDEIEWQAVFRSLELQQEDPETWPQGEIRQKAQELGLFLREQGRPSSERFKIIGQVLYNTVFGSEGIRRLLDRLLRTESEPVLEFHIQDEGSVLQAYPWELLHDSEKFLFEGKRAFPVRHVDFEESITPFELTEVLRTLYIAPRPDMSFYEGYANLPVLERLHLEYLSRYYPDHLVLESLPANTLDALQKHLMGSKIHVVHIDAHGGFGWLCQCQRLNPPRAKECATCGQTRPDGQRDQGYLAFETADGKVDWVSGEELGKRLHGRGIQLVVLSACRSALVGGASTFNSVAGALVKNRVPAVVAMQFSIKVNQAEKFVEFFYWALMNGMPLTQAVAESRIALTKDWYRPVLYLRTDASNYRGTILALKSTLVPPKRLGPREKWIAQLGFKRDPFRYIDGGTDQFLQEYFYFRMRHFYDVFDVSRPGTVFVFGPRGSGKSSMRNVISQLCQKEEIFPVVYRDFSLLVHKCQQGEGEGIQIEDHVTQILKTALRALAGLTDGNAVTLSSEVNDQDRIIRRQLMSYVVKYEDDSFRRFALQNLLNADPESEGNWPTSTRELWGRFCRNVTKLFGYKSVYILIDPNDDIASNEDVAWKVLEPLLSACRLLEPLEKEDRWAFKLFLGQRARERLGHISWFKDEQNKRCYDLRWDDSELRKLLQERLRGSSSSRYEALVQLAPGVDDLDDRVIELSRSSPRELIVICDRLFSEHCRRWSPEDEEHLLITRHEVEEVLRPFEERHRQSELEQLITQGESDKVEFKSTMQCNMDTRKRDERMERGVVKTICAFMNTEGGTLIIGVDNVGNAIGLEADFSTLHTARQNQDGFEQRFAEIIEQYLGLGVRDYISARFERYKDQLIYRIDVQKSSEPVYCQFDGKSQFFVRVFTTTRELDPKETLEYCLRHFNVG